MSENGDQTGGIVGSFNNLMRLIERTKPESVHIVWEGGGSNKKRGIYKSYKKGVKPQKLNRYYDDIPDSIQNRNYQIKKLIEIINFFPINQLYIENAEADDAIGYLSSYIFKHKNKIIVSSDHDYYQLLGKDVLIWSPTLKAFVNEDKVMLRYNIHPENFCLAKCIVGDKSDNIPGIKGVGYKVLSKSFPKLTESCFYSMSDLLSDAAHMSTKSKKLVFRRILEGEDIIKRNWKLVLLETNNLSHFQTQKLIEKVENFTPTWKNMNAYKSLNESGIRGIDLLAHSTTFRDLLKGVQ